MTHYSKKHIFTLFILIGLSISFVTVTQADKRQPAHTEGEGRNVVEEEIIEEAEVEEIVVEEEIEEEEIVEESEIEEVIVEEEIVEESEIEEVDKITVPTFIPPPKETQPTKMPADASSGLGSPRGFDEQSLEELRNDPAFDYSEEKEKEKKKKEEEQENDFNFPDLGLSKEAINLIGQILLYSLLAIVVVFVIIRLFNSNFRQLFFRRKVQPVTVNIFEDLPEDVNIHELNFTSLLDEAVANKQYRKAVRIHYLQALKRLTDRELIDWQVNKTNADYLLELREQQPSLISPFSNITRLFDYIWYGNFEIDADSYQQVDREFDTFNGKVKAINIPETID